MSENKRSDEIRDEDVRIQLAEYFILSNRDEINSKIPGFSEEKKYSINYGFSKGSCIPIIFEETENGTKVYWIDREVNVHTDMTSNLELEAYGKQLVVKDGKVVEEIGL